MVKEMDFLFLILVMTLLGPSQSLGIWSKGSYPNYDPPAPELEQQSGWEEVGGSMLNKRVPYYENIWPFTIYRPTKEINMKPPMAPNTTKLPPVARKVVSPMDICFSGFPLHCFRAFRKTPVQLRKTTILGH